MSIQLFNDLTLLPSSRKYPSLVELGEQIDAELNAPSSEPFEEAPHLFERLVEFDEHVHSMAEESVVTEAEQAPLSLSVDGETAVLKQLVKGGIPALNIDFETGISSQLLEKLPYDVRIVLSHEGEMLEIHLPEDAPERLRLFCCIGEAFFEKAVPQAQAVGIDAHFQTFLESDGSQQSFTDTYTLGDEIDRITSTFARDGDRVELHMHRSTITVRAYA